LFGVKNISFKLLSTKMEENIFNRRKSSLQKEGKLEIYQFNQEKPLEGIFFHFLNQNRKEEIQITSSSTQANSPSDVIDSSFNSHWVSDNQPNQFLKFDFGVYSVSVTHYTLRTYDYVFSGNHLKSWMLEGSIKDENWIEIDSRSDCPDLNGKRFMKTYEVKHQSFFRYLRLRQTGPSHCGTHMMAISNVEFFGIVVKI
jgi:hypothetical protein